VNTSKTNTSNKSKPTDLKEIYLLPTSAVVREYRLRDMEVKTLPEDPKERVKVLCGILDARAHLPDETPRFVDCGLAWEAYRQTLLPRREKAALRKAYFRSYVPGNRDRFSKDASAALAWLRVEKAGLPGPTKRATAYELSKLPDDDQVEAYRKLTKENKEQRPTLSQIRNLRSPKKERTDYSLLSPTVPWKALEHLEHFREAIEQFDRQKMAPVENESTMDKFLKSHYDLAALVAKAEADGVTLPKLAREMVEHALDGRHSVVQSKI
jgi:hypothetical protein